MWGIFVKKISEIDLKVIKLFFYWISLLLSFDTSTWRVRNSPSQFLFQYEQFSEK